MPMPQALHQLVADFQASTLRQCDVSLAKHGEGQINVNVTFGADVGGGDGQQSVSYKVNAQGRNLAKVLEELTKQSEQQVAISMAVRKATLTA